ncbi:MAG: response regulator [Chloroflexi bacterium]|nr:MAG: response regulator [Chloroflexota bacterium]
MSATRVLIAEDNELVALTLEEQLSNLGYAVVGVAHSGSEAVRLCTQLNPDIVIMDMQMPEMTGDAAAQQIAKQHPTPVIMLTAYSDTEHIRKAELSGALAYLIKPVNPEELPPTIDVAIARFREMQRLREQVGELQETIEARKIIERAKGILMQRRNIGGEEAYELMRQWARERQRKVKDIAQAIVDAESLLS